MKRAALWILGLAISGYSFNLPDTALDPIGNWGPLTFYPDSAKDRLYKLPWDSGKIVYLNDGAYNRPTSHHKGYEYDFDMPIGSAVLSARSGYIHLFTGYEGSADLYNTVLQIIHSDVDSIKRHTTVDWYVHVQDTSLSKLGLKRGQFIQQGQLIALSGKDGSYAHLHFEVQEMNHIGVGGFKHGAFQPIESVPAPFVEVTQWKDGLPFRYVSLKSQNKRFVPTSVERSVGRANLPGLQCVPSPVKGRAVISVRGILNVERRQIISIYNSLGQCVEWLSAYGVRSASGGTREYEWNPNSYPSGVYHIVIPSNGGIQSVKTIVLQ